MASTVTVKTKTLEAILSKLDKLADDIDVLKKSVLNPSYGSDEWWEKSIKAGEEDIKKGRVTVVHNAKELQSHLDSLKGS